MPFGECTIPSTFSVLTCSPPLPGGRFLAASAWAFCRRPADSKRVAAPRFGYLAFRCRGRIGLPPPPWLRAFWKRALRQVSTKLFPLAAQSPVLELVGAVVGCACACEQVAATAAVSKIPLTSVITERIVRSFPLRAFQPLQVGVRAPGAEVGLTSAGLVKKVVAVKIADTVVPGRSGYLAPVALSGSSNFKSPTLMIRDNRLMRVKKSSKLKYGPSGL